MCCTDTCPDDYLHSAAFDSCYKVYTPTEKWQAQDYDTAVRMCQSAHSESHLLTVTSDEEMSYISVMLTAQPRKENIHMYSLI